MHVIDTTDMTEREVAEAVLAWSHRALTGEASTL
jgi:hypothetical protein